MSERMNSKEYQKIISKGKKKNPETIIQNSIRERLRANGWFVIRHQQGLGCHPGLCDLTVLRDGITLYLEIKRPRGILSDNQKIFKADIERAGCQYIVAKSLDDIDNLCDRESKRLF